MKTNKGVAKNKLVLKEAVNETITKFSYTTSFVPNQSLTIEKQGNTPVFLRTSQTFYNRQPQTKRQPYQSKEAHREYFKDRTAIFCENLGIGVHTFKITLEPRFTGTYTLNPAKVEQMYFPVFYGRNGVEKVRIR